jgi:hypothetical protein
LLLQFQSAGKLAGRPKESLAGLRMAGREKKVAGRISKKGKIKYAGWRQDA